jgi:hypothetical protein
MKNLLFMLFMLFCFNVLAEKQNIDTNISKFENRIEILEGQKENLEDNYSNKIESLNIKYDQSISNLNNKLYWCISIGIATIILIIGGCIKIYRSALKFAQKEIEKRLTNLLKDNENNIRKLINSMEIDNRIKNNKSILVLCRTIENKDYCQKLFDEFDFKHVNTKLIENYKELTGYDLKVIDNHSNKFSNELIEEFINKSSERELFLYFGEYNPKLKKHHDKINFANTKFTLYTNLINLLKFSEAINK